MSITASYGVIFERRYRLSKPATRLRQAKDPLVISWAGTMQDTTATFTLRSVYVRAVFFVEPH